MMPTLRYGMLVALLMLVLAACGAVPAAVQPTGEALAAKPTGEAMAAKPTGEAMVAKPTGEAMAVKPTGEATAAKPTGEAMAAKPTGEATAAKPTGEAMAAKPTGEAMAEQAAWMTLPLTDVRTGQSFTLADFAGRPVYVETMATWCPNCRAQLITVQEATVALEGQPPVFVALSVETTLPPTELAQYAAENGFTPIFAVATPEILQALVDSFGRTITNPSSTPHFVIAPNGSQGELMTGFSSTDQIVALLNAAKGP